MKTLNVNIFKIVLLSLFCTILLATSSCQKSQSKDSATSDSNVKAPEIDLHTAVLTDNMEAVNQHIQAGSNINEQDPFGGSSPLITASLFGKEEMAKVLLDAGADVNFQNNDGSTALHVAAFFCRPEIVKILLAHDADKSIKNKFGATPYETVAVPFKDVKNTYDIMGTSLAPMGLKLDYTYLEQTRPEIAAMLK